MTSLAHRLAALAIAHPALAGFGIGGVLGFLAGVLSAGIALLGSEARA